MKKTLRAVFACLVLCLLLPLTALRAEAAEYDHIRYCGIQVQPNTEDGSLYMKATFEWEAVEELPYGQELKIGIPNGSIRDVTALTDNIESLDFDNSYLYVYLTEGYDAGQVFTFSYSWVQEYMYTLDGDGGVRYDYTPGWFDEISIDRMELQWHDPTGAASELTMNGEGGDWQMSDGVIVGTELPYGAQVHVTAAYPDWPTALAWENSTENLPQEEYPDYWEPQDWEEDGSDISAFFAVVVVVIVAFVLISLLAAANDGYRGGFGTRYVFVHGLWYPAGPDGHPRPGSVGTKHKPDPPHGGGSRGGFGGGSRGGGFGGGGFGGGGHCACASSCACACACACAGGGRAGCSAKNLYGAVQLSDEVTNALQ